MAIVSYGSWLVWDWEHWREFCMRPVRAQRHVKSCGRAPKKAAITFAVVPGKRGNRLSNGPASGREAVNQQKEQFRAAYEAGRQAYHEATAETGTSKNL